MIDPIHIPLSKLKQLFDPAYVSKNKIECIKALRAISGEGLKETKNFYEQILEPALNNKNKVSAGFIPNPDDEPDLILSPPMYLIGHTYRQLNKEVVLIVGAANQNTSYETVYSIDSDGCLIHRYNRRDYGRTTGTSYEFPDPRNLEKI